MKRTCSQCKLPGIKVGKVVTLGPMQCEFCGTEYEIARYRNLPYSVAGLLAVAFILLWLTDKLNGISFLMLCGVWLTFDLIWESLAPLRPIRPPDAGATSMDSGNSAARLDGADTDDNDANKLVG